MIRFGPLVKPRLKVNPMNIGSPTKIKTSNRGGKDKANPKKEGLARVTAREPSSLFLLRRDITN